VYSTTIKFKPKTPRQDYMMVPIFRHTFIRVNQGKNDMMYRTFEILSCNCVAFYVIDIVLW